MGDPPALRNVTATAITTTTPAATAPTNATRLSDGRVVTITIPDPTAAPTQAPRPSVRMSASAIIATRLPLRTRSEGLVACKSSLIPKGRAIARNAASALALPNVAVARPTPPDGPAVNVAATVCSTAISETTNAPASKALTTPRASVAFDKDWAVSQNNIAYDAMVTKPSNLPYEPKSARFAFAAKMVDTPADATYARMGRSRGVLRSVNSPRNQRVSMTAVRIRRNKRAASSLGKTTWSFVDHRTTRGSPNAARRTSHSWARSRRPLTSVIAAACSI